MKTVECSTGSREEAMDCLFWRLFIRNLLINKREIRGILEAQKLHMENPNSCFPYAVLS